MKYSILFTIFMTATGILGAQQQNPSNIKWKRIKTDHFEVVFSDEITTQAQRAANILEHIYLADTKTLDIKPKPITLLLFNQSTNTNGYSSMAPRKMAWYITPLQNNDLGVTDWFSNLAVHEFRHVAQYQKNNQNFTKFFSIFYGQFGQVMLTWSVPHWFYEGDAVHAETTLSNCGRGRVPKFNMPLRTILMTNQKFNYDQAVFRSYKKYFPDQYTLGYHLVTHARNEFGADIWSKTYQRTTKFSFYPYAFSSSLKKYSKINLSKNYDSAIKDLRSLWSKQLENLTFTKADILNKVPKKSWTNYVDPQYLNDSTVIVRKASLDAPPAFYKLYKNGKEEKIMQTDADFFSANSDYIVWARTNPDIRWGERDFSDIMLLDIKTKSVRQLTKKGKFFAPSVSLDGTRIAAVEYNQKMLCSLVVLDAKSGTELVRIESPGNQFIQLPKWSPDGKLIAMVYYKSNGQALAIYDVESKKITEILPNSSELIGKPVFYKNYLIYNSGYSGIDNIYAVDLQTKQKYQVTSRKFGAFNACVSSDNQKFLFQDYNTNGYDIAEMNIDPSSWKKIEEVENRSFNYSQSLIKEEQGGNILKEEDIPNNQYEITKYNKAKNLFNFHSWGLFSSDPYMEFLVLSDNKLNTFSTETGIMYDQNTNTSIGVMNFRYAKYFPIFKVSSTFGTYYKNYPFRNNTTNKIDTVNDFWHESAITTGMTLPFNLSRGIYYTNLSFGMAARMAYSPDKTYRSADDLRRDKTFTSMIYNLAFSNYRESSSKDFLPKFGQNLQIYFKQLPFGTNYEGQFFHTSANLYFPGFIKHHSLKLQGAFESQKKYTYPADKLYYFSSMMLFPRGYKALSYELFSKFSVDYQFPIIYPDWNIGPFIYFKRIRGGIFYDYGNGSYTKYFIDENRYAVKRDEYQSAGGQLIFEVHFLRLQTPVEIGCRASYSLNQTKLRNNEYFLIEPLIIGIPLGIINNGKSFRQTGYTF